MPHADKIDKTPAGEPGIWKRHVSFFRIALLFAVAGQSAVALSLHFLGKAGLIDFAAADPGGEGAFHVLAGAFVLQTILILIALARIGLNMKRLTASVAALTVAFAAVMILFVTLQCDLYGACL